MASVLEDFAAVALAQHDPSRAARLLGAAEALRNAIGTVIAPCERPQHNQVTRAVRAALGDEAFDAALRQGQLASSGDLTADLPAAPPAEEPPAPQAKAKVKATASRPKAEARPRPGSAEPPRPAAGPLRIRTLGAATVEIGGAALTAADWSYAKPRELMFLLVSSPPVTKDQIAAALWPELSRPQLGNALHTALRELRRALGDPGWVRYADGQYRFDRSRPHECDVTAFEDALMAARRARPAEAALPELQRAIAAYGGDFLDGMAAGEWALVRRDELRRAFESALLATGRLHAAAGRHQAAAAAFRRAVAHEPLNESAHRELMSSWAALGETARAVRHYEELTTLLREQVGVAPAAETEALHRRLLGPGTRTG
jgi:DNA-binding SARP family transcriptional activator